MKGRGAFSFCCFFFCLKARKRAGYDTRLWGKVMVAVVEGGAKNMMENVNDIAVVCCCERRGRSYCYRCWWCVYSRARSSSGKSINAGLDDFFFEPENSFDGVDGLDGK